jgi:hypothetical protein
MQAKVLVLALLMAVPPGAATADPRSEWPNPSMSNADLRKSCSSEASRVYRMGRGFRTDKAYMSKLRRDYRKDCVSKVKRQRKSLRVLGLLGPMSPAAAGS